MTRSRTSRKIARYLDVRDPRDRDVSVSIYVDRMSRTARQDKTVATSDVNFIAARKGQKLHVARYGRRKVRPEAGNRSPSRLLAGHYKRVERIAYEWSVNFRPRIDLARHPHPAMRTRTKQRAKSDSRGVRASDTRASERSDLGTAFHACI